MRYVRLSHAGVDHWARLVDDETAMLLTGAPYDGGLETSRLVRLEEASLLAPVTPSKILCVGRNYRAHAEELGNEVPKEPLLFFKPPSALLGPGGAVELPTQSQRVEHEAELGVVVGQRLRDASEGEARAAIFGLTCVNDVTARDLQRRDVQFTRGKGFDTFCPVGPWVTTGVSPDDLAVSLRVDGEVRQEGRTSMMLWDVGALLAYASAVMTLEPGDLVCTGTPAGVGPLHPGDRVAITIDAVGTLEHGVIARMAPKSA
ncbi:MAG: fumarylacetoacetate hydrolase family protein [Deltaproteobacteria bacterium]|nr:fumarylacetoacetate hydrolase family protein [Deltaproteobacteria bacterium]